MTGLNSTSDGLLTDAHVELNGPVMVIAFNKAGQTTGTFDHEMLQLNHTGSGIMIRESPTKASIGKATITDIGGGMYYIESFFDVFTELGLDGGDNWIPNKVERRV